MEQSDKLKISATTRFLFEAIFLPQRIGALLPSSKHLAGAMARWLPDNFNDYALELGPGTGAVTQALLERGLPENRLIAIEKSPQMAGLLMQRFPRATIVAGDAFKLDELLNRHARHAGRIGAVFCSIPLRNFRAHVAHNLARQVRALLPEGGRLVQYTYRIASTPPKAEEHFHSISSDVVWRNFPPARVSVYEK